MQKHVHYRDRYVYACLKCACRFILRICIPLYTYTCSDRQEDDDEAMDSVRGDLAESGEDDLDGIPVSDDEGIPEVAIVPASEPPARVAEANMLVNRRAADRLVRLREIREEMERLERGSSPTCVEQLLYGKLRYTLYSCICKPSQPSIYVLSHTQNQAHIVIYNCNTYIHVTALKSTNLCVSMYM